MKRGVGVGPNKRVCHAQAEENRDDYPLQMTCMKQETSPDDEKRRWLDTITGATKQAVIELIEVAKLREGSRLIIGCSTSEIAGYHIGKASNLHVAEAVYTGLYDVTQKQGIQLAIQCCEHLNRALVIEKQTVTTEEIVNVIPQPKAGGSLATVAYERFKDPCVVEFIRADAGVDIGDTLIGMHLTHVAVPVRLSVTTIGYAHVTAARTRPKSIGGSRAIYNEELG